MGSNYGKGVYNQLLEVMEKLNAMESEHRQDRKEIKVLTCEVASLRSENAHLREEVFILKQDNAVLEGKVIMQETENCLLHDDNERMKRILANDSPNISTPPSKDQPGKLLNTFNSRKAI